MSGLILPSKAITLWQPWASAMYYRFKRNETRSWYTAYRGPLVIHAAKCKRVKIVEGTRAGQYYDLEEFFERPEIKSCFADVGITRFDQLPFGCGLLQCRLKECVPASPLNYGKLERIWGNYSPGRFAWVTEEAVNFPEPVPASGAQCLWNWAREPEPTLL